MRAAEHGRADDIAALIAVGADIENRDYHVRISQFLVFGFDAHRTFERVAFGWDDFTLTQVLQQ